MVFELIMESARNAEVAASTELIAIISLAFMWLNDQLEKV